MRSEIISGSRRSIHYHDHSVELYPKHYDPGESVQRNLRFCLRYEAWDPGIMAAAMKAIDPFEIKVWIHTERAGGYSRRAWFLYEWFTGKRLDVPDVTEGPYVDALDSKLHLVAKGRKSKRHRVNNNLLGVEGLCPFVRRTRKLDTWIQAGLKAEAQTFLGAYDDATLARAVNYLYTKETKSSFAIEGETPNASRTERFVRALREAARFEPSERSLVELQNSIVDPRYAAKGWRQIQNFIGDNVLAGRGKVHFVCPKPDDVAGLMRDWVRLSGKLETAGVDPIVAAALTSFAFVFIHPFEDGNGRIHRFLIHRALAKGGFGPEGLIFPVSASILRDASGYDRVLESFSQPLLELTDWEWTDGDEIVVSNDTADYFRYFDATRFVEYLYERVADTIRVDLVEELRYLKLFERAANEVREIVDMPDKKLALFVRLTLQNQGRLAKNKRQHFAEITDEELERMESEVVRAIEESSSSAAPSSGARS